MKKNGLLLFLLISVFSACKPDIQKSRILTVMTHDSFSVSEDLIRKFEAENDIELKFLKAGDTGTALNKAILSKNSPLADVFYGVDNTFLSRALDEKIFLPYESKFLSDIPEIFILDPEYHALPVDYGDICFNYDVAFFEENDIPQINSLNDLLKPEYKDLIVVQNPATSSPGLGFLFLTISQYGDPGYLKFWEGLIKNNVKVVNDWETAYYSEFSRWGGTHPIVLSYSSSPPFEVIFSEEPIDKPPTNAITSNNTCYRQIEFVGILKGTKNRGLAEAFVDFMLSTDFQEDIPLQMYVFPVNQTVILDETFIKYLEIPESPAMLNPAEIAAHREDWIKTWTDNVLR